MLRLLLVSLTALLTACGTQEIVRYQYQEVPPALLVTQPIPEPVNPLLFKTMTCEQQVDALAKYISELLPLTQNQNHQIEWISDWSREQKSIWEQRNETKP